jgi:hypothetical protein
MIATASVLTRRTYLARGVVSRCLLCSSEGLLAHAWHCGIRLPATSGVTGDLGRRLAIYIGRLSKHSLIGPSAPTPWVSR